MNFGGKVALVTGGASGIGLGIVKSFLAEGARIAILDLRKDHLEKACAELAKLGFADHVAPYQVDVSDRAAFQSLIPRICERFGRVDILVNNAGVGIQRSLEKTSFADWDFALQVNLGGVINGLMLLLPILMANEQGGYIVKTSSLAGLVPPSSDFTIYGTTKAAITALTESLAPALHAAGIGISLLCPGLVRSNIREIDLNRPDRFAASVADREQSREEAEWDRAPGWIEPEEVGQMVVDGIRARALHIITHPHYRADFIERSERILQAWPVPPAISP